MLHFSDYFPSVTIPLGPFVVLEMSLLPHRLIYPLVFRVKPERTAPLYTLLLTFSGVKVMSSELVGSPSLKVFKKHVQVALEDTV